MTINRRSLLKSTFAATTMGAIINNPLFAAEDAPNPKSNKFLIYIHLGSSCGVANGLHHPMKVGTWPSGLFKAGTQMGSNNPLLNSHTAAGSMIFHDYVKFLAPMADDMCLVSGTSQSLDHGAAANLQMRGNSLSTISPEWAMGVAQFMKTPARPNPMVLTNGAKTTSVTDITPVSAGNIDEFKRITRDVDDIGKISKDRVDPIWSVLKKRFAAPGLASVIPEASLPNISTYQIDTLRTGLAELSKVDADVTALKAKMSQDSVTKLVAGSADRAAIINTSNNDGGFKDRLILAGILAKTGLANGMTINAMGDDLHGGSGDVASARNASSKWASVALFWEWIKESNLQNDVMVIVSHEFGRSPYNAGNQDEGIVDASGKPMTVKCPGRDHGLSLGMMFINGNVPKAGRIGQISDNFAPVATKDAKGTLDPSGLPYTAENMVGSMLLRCWDDIFPTERMVRKHWPTFKEIAPILA